MNESYANHSAINQYHTANRWSSSSFATVGTPARKKCDRRMAPGQSLLGIILIAVTALFAYVVQQNPLLFGRKHAARSSTSSVAVNDQEESYYRIYTHHPVLEQHLEPFHIGHSDDGASVVTTMSDSDYVAYRNHCLRVLTFAVHHCGEPCSSTNTNNGNNNNHWVDLMAMALAYHDIGLWSDRQLDYLQPSARQMRAHNSNKGDDTAVVDGEEESGDGAPIWSEADLWTAREIILQHHKWTEWTVRSGDDVVGMTTAKDTDALKQQDITVRTLLVNAVRKGDWADATMGLVRFGLPAPLLEQAYERIPEAGFHALLLQMGSRLSPDSLRGRLDVLKILKW